MKNYRLLAGVVMSFGAGLAGSSASAQRTLSAAQIDSIVRPDVNTCASSTASAARSATGTTGVTAKVEDAGINPERIIPAANRRDVGADRVARTLNGVWRGEVKGDKGEVHVDYFWIIDTKQNEALIIAQRSGEQTVTGASQFANPPKLTYVMCAHDGYSPSTNTPQIHEFTKISDRTDNAAQLIQKATGLKMGLKHPTLSAIWQRLISSGYFDGLPYVAFAGGFFKPIQLGSVASVSGPSQIALNWDAEYRGGGSTKLKYTTGVPTIGSERAQFVGTSAKSGDYLVSSPGNGSLWKVEAYPANDTGAAARAAAKKTTASARTLSAMIIDGDYDLAFDSVTLGPLQ